MITITNIIWPNLSVVAKCLGVPIDNCNYRTFSQLINEKFVRADLLISFTTVIKATQYEVINWSNYIGVQYNKDAEIALVYGNFQQWMMFVDYIIGSNNHNHNLYRQIVSFLEELKNYDLITLDINKEGKVIKWKVKN